MNPTANIKRASPIVLAVAALMVLAALGLRLKQMVADRRPVLADVTVNGRTFVVEVATTARKKEVGLGGRDALAADRGMYFPFPSAEYWVFWMKDMRFPIDIIWIRDGKVVDIDADVPVPAGKNLETYSPAEPADAVLELNAGTSAGIGLKAGDEILLSAKPGAS